MNAKEEIKKFHKKKMLWKTLTWRFLSTLTTFVVAYAVTGNLGFGGLIALIEGVIKMIIYYFHERKWDGYSKRHIKQIKSRYRNPLMHGYETDRLRFRALTMHDCDIWMQFVNDEKAMKYFNYETGSRADCEKWIAKNISRYGKDGNAWMALINKETGEFIGQCGIISHNIDGVEECEIGYAILPKYWGKGYASEAANACKDYVFENDINDYVVSMINPGNFASESVAKKNGMEFWKSTIYREEDVDIWRADKIEE